MPRSFLMAMLVSSGLFAFEVRADEPAKPEAKRSAKPAAAKKDKEAKVTSLFDGESLGHWKSTNFGGEGEVEVDDENKTLILHIGTDLTGVTWQKPDLLPETNYEIRCEAMRIDGGDFFCGVTFPVKKRFCSLIVGGWGGGVCGISSIDGNDASENETTSYREFEAKKWYRVRVRVRGEHIEAWVDDKQIVDVDVKDRRLNVRGEVDLSQPLGFASWRTTAALRKIELVRLDGAEKPAADKPSQAK